MRLRLLMVFVMASMMGSSVLAADSTSQKKFEEQRRRIKEKETEMNGSKWDVVLGSLDPKIKGQKDTFIFQDNQVTSTGMSKRGFGSTNYTVTVPDEADSDLGIWETMKTGKDGVIFIRGEWAKEAMRGYVTEQLEEGKKVNEYTFNTSTRIAISPSSSEEPGSGSLKSDATSSKETGNDDSSPNALVSRETHSTSVSSFAPGTTNEVSKTTKKRGY